ncbi:hypothetical protein VVD49_13410 [Uliginosibacterium sp. H3]|uniref:Uncharacterized protein n=1 Tax=Uliginosibacterium silvisoli TaxID=3114758 RepID=A0ABU6K5M3_9RHOO|nr:hypothetical protein [Uliginosibacterium sp. H3]
MMAKHFQRDHEAMAMQLCFDFYQVFELLAQMPTKLQAQALALAKWAEAQKKKNEEEAGEPKKQCLLRATFIKIMKWLRHWASDVQLMVL